MTISKFGSPADIKVVQSGLTFDPNIVVKQLQDKVKNGSISLDQLHEAVKSIGIVDYTSEDMNRLISLLKSVGIAVIQ